MAQDGGWTTFQGAYIHPVMEAKYRKYRQERLVLKCMKLLENVIILPESSAENLLCSIRYVEEAVSASELLVRLGHCHAMTHQHFVVH